MAQSSVMEPRPMVISPPNSVLEVDEHATSSDDSVLSDSASITTSITQWEWENGRRYHAYKAGSYPLPNDERELDRIDLKHHVMMLICDAHLHLAPLVQPRRVLDIGTGTGIWAIQMAEQNPECMVWGTDLSPVQPSWVPDNVRFEIDDVEAKDWTWPDNHFDYIHSRFMVAAIGSWSRLIRKAFQHTKPGGYFEMQELDPRFKSDDGSLREDSNLSKWSELICDASAKYNRPVPYYDEYVRWFEKAGFVDVRCVYLKCPTNPWPKDRVLKEAGRFQLVAHVEGLEGLSVGLLTRAMGWKEEEVKVLMAKIRPELNDRSIHSYQTTAVIVGRKPEMPRTPDSFRQSAGYGSAPLTPTSCPPGPADLSQSSAGEPARSQAHDAVPQPLAGGLNMNPVSAIIPVVDIQAPTDTSLRDPSFHSS